MKDYKKILIVDDSEIDREILKGILEGEFLTAEASNGYAAFEMILKQGEYLDAIMLDVSMPVLDGFSVLQLMHSKNINIPVFMITAEATKENIEKAAMLNVSEFIRKPFDREDVLTRLKAKLGVFEDAVLGIEDIEETNRYIANLMNVYDKFLANTKEDNKHYKRMVGLMRILLNRYSANTFASNLDKEKIEIVSQSAYFCNIGHMLTVRGRSANWDEEEAGVSLADSHTTLGAEIIRINPSKHCTYFVHICSDICTNHHERYDGAGYPGRTSGGNLSVYAQMCSLVERFDILYSKYREHNDLQFDFVVSELAQDRGYVSKDIFTLLTDSKFNVTSYYNA